MIRSCKELIRDLEKEGLHFRSFSFVHEGNYDTEDADWNYKDVPHLHHIHQLVEALPARVEKDLIVSVNMQKILFFRFPMTLVNFESGDNSQMYFTTLVFFTIVIETVWLRAEENRTKVTTTYNIGSPWLLLWLMPFIKILMKRNYDDLMSGDIPMRTRRGLLRSWGYSFHHAESRYGFIETMSIAKENVVPPKSSDEGSETQSFDIQGTFKKVGSQCFWGRSDHLGLRMIRSIEAILVFPRMCPHEGALLDESSCSKEVIRCPWHGRGFKPIAKLPLKSEAEVSITTDLHSIIMKDGVITVGRVNRRN